MMISEKSDVIEDNEKRGGADSSCLKEYKFLL